MRIKSYKHSHFIHKTHLLNNVLDCFLCPQMYYASYSNQIFIFAVGVDRGRLRLSLDFQGVGAPPQNITPPLEEISQPIL
jgi:hypothetical protein